MSLLAKNEDSFFDNDKSSFYVPIIDFGLDNGKMQYNWQLYLVLTSVLQPELTVEASTPMQRAKRGQKHLIRSLDDFHDLKGLAWPDGAMAPIQSLKSDPKCRFVYDLVPCTSPVR
jgi:hypothetical protein